MNVVSFYAPRPEHPFFQDYTPFLDLLRLSCERFGHRHVVLTDDSAVGPDAYVSELPRSLMRAFVAAQLAYLSDPQFADTPTLLTGADCVLSDNLDTFAAIDADIVITTDDRFTDCRMNMGAVYIPRPAAVTYVWARALDAMGYEWGDDQRAVYAALKASRLRIVELPCDPYNLAPEHPGDDCRRGVVLHFRGARKRWMADYCHHWLGLGEGVQLRLLPNTEAETAIANVCANLKAGLPAVELCDPHERDAVIVGSGPSVADDIGLIRDMADRGAMVFALNGAARWLHEQHVPPDFGVILDMRASNTAFLCPARYGWLMASHCDPSVVGATNPVTLFHFAQDEVKPYLPPGIMVGGGPTVGLTALPLVFALGFRRFHLFGYDSSEREGATHVAEQAETPSESRRLTVFCDDREFITTPAMYAQAQAFETVCDSMMDAGAETIVVHGSGLLPTLAQKIYSSQLLGEAA